MRSRKEIRQTGTIPAQDEYGKRYTIIKYTEFHATPTFGDPNGETRGLDSYRLPDGDHVNKISDTEFYCLLNEVTLRPLAK